MAQLINRKSPAVIAANRAKGLPFVSVKIKGLHFTKEAASMIKLKTGKYIHFINDGNYWALYANDDPDGFKITADHKDGGFILYSTQLSRLFRSSVGANIGNRFFITRTNAKYNNEPLFEIVTTNTVDVIIDKQKRMNEQKKLEKEYCLNLKPGRGAAKKQ